MQVTIVGAGPVGLALSLQLTQQRHTVTVYEKRSSYTRTQNVRLKPARLPHSMRGLPPIVRLCDLETQLRAEAEGVGVAFCLEEIQDLEPFEGVVVLATGSKCALRDRYIGPPVHLSEPKLVVVCRYQATNHPRPLAQLTEWYPTMKILEGVATEQIKGDTVGLFWEPPASISQDGVLDRLRFWLNLRHDDIVPGTLLHSSYRSTLFRAPTFAKQVGNKKIFVVGDCALGVPYFKSLQNGLQNLKFFSVDPTFYNEEMQTYTVPLASSALLQTTSLDMASLFLRVSRNVPWQVNAWSEPKVRELMSRDVEGL